jgi:hypothetical protein
VSSYWRQDAPSNAPSTPETSEANLQSHQPTISGAVWQSRWEVGDNQDENGAGGRLTEGKGSPTEVRLLPAKRVSPGRSTSCGGRSGRAQHLILEKDQRLPVRHITDRQTRSYMKSRQTEPPAVAAAKVGFSSSALPPLWIEADPRLSRKRRPRERRRPDPLAGVWESEIVPI